MSIQNVTSEILASPEMVQAANSPRNSEDSNSKLTRKAYYEQRLKSIKADAPSNCMGTAFFLSGLQDKDLFVNKENTKILWDSLVKLEQPEDFCLVGLFDATPRALSHSKIDILYHTGVITSTHPKIRLTHRDGDSGPLSIDEGLEDFIIKSGEAPSNFRQEYRRFPLKATSTLDDTSTY